MPGAPERVRHTPSEPSFLSSRDGPRLVTWQHAT